MDSGNLIQWLQNPSLLDGDSLSKLRMLLDSYPCFTVARVLYLKNLYLLNDLSYSNELIRTAISVPDRRCLYYFIEDKPYPESTYAFEKEINKSDGFSIIDRFLHSTVSDHASVNDSTPHAKSIPSTDFVSMTQHEESFSLDYVSYLNQNPALLSTESDSPMEGKELIDAFLYDVSNKETHFLGKESNKTERQEQDKLLAMPEETDPAAAVLNMPDGTFTETLAKIYIKQKRYEKAIEILGSLSLKYPEKNVYFADQIRYLEKVIYNIKKD